MKEGADIALLGSLIGDPALRKARVCYNHLAGEMGVRALDSLLAEKYLIQKADDLDLTDRGVAFLKRLDIDAAQLEKTRRPLCKSCLDWSARRRHLAGSIGTALLDRFYDLGWATRVEGSRIVAFSALGEKKFLERFPLLRAARL